MPKRGRPKLPEDQVRAKVPIRMLIPKFEELKQRAKRLSISPGEYIELMMQMTN